VNKSILISNVEQISAVMLVGIIFSLLFLIIPQEYKIECVFLIGIVVLFGIVAFRNFFHTLCILILATPFLFSVEIGNDSPISLQGLFSILIIMVGVSYFLVRQLTGKAKEFPAVKPFMLIILFSSFSVFYSPDVSSALFKIGRIASYFSLYVLLVANLDSWQKIKTSIRVVYLSYLIPFLIALHQFVGVFYSDIRLLDLERVGITSKNSFGIIVGMLALFLVGKKLILTESAIKQMRKNVLFFVPSLMLLFLSATRTAWLGFIGALCLFLVFYGRGKNKVIIVFCFFAFILIFRSPIVEGTADLINTQVLRGTNTFDNAVRGSFGGRVFVYWPQGINAWLEHPIVGHGLGSTEYLMYRFSNVIEKPPHSEYIQILQEIGVIGFVLYLFLLWRFFRPMSRGLKSISRFGLVEEQKENLLGGLMVLVGFIIMSVGQETFHNGSIGILFVIFMAISHATYLVAKKELHTQNRY
jgi:O-antigen ligase